MRYPSKSASCALSTLLFALSYSLERELEELPASACKMVELDHTIGCFGTRGPQRRLDSMCVLMDYQDLGCVQSLDEAKRNC